MDPNIQQPPITSPPNVAPAQNPSAQSPPPKPSDPGKKKWLFTVAALFILTIMIFIPIPEYRGIALCKMGIPCPAAGWYLGPSPFTRIAMRIQSQNLEQGTTTPIVTQAPSPTPDLNREPTGSAATANWKTYVNSKHGYSFKYPSGWRIVQDVEDNLVIVNFPISEERGSGALDPVKDKGKASVRIAAGDKPQGMKIEEYVDQQIKEMQPYTYKKDITKENKVINGKSVILADVYAMKGPWPVIDAFIEKSGTEIITVSANIDYPSYKETFDQILSTFQFTNQITYACPKTKNIDCMPIVEESRKAECNPEYLRWIQTYCPGVKITQ